MAICSCGQRFLGDMLFVYAVVLLYLFDFFPEGNEHVYKLR